jgi:hypothetical protein
MRADCTKRGNRWYAVIDSGPEYKTRITLRASGRMVDAETVIANLLHQHLKGDRGGVSTDTLTVAEYLTKTWLPAQASRVRPATYRHYRHAANLLIGPRVGDIPLSDLTPEDIEAFHRRLLTEPRPGGARLSATTARNARLILRHALTEAKKQAHVGSTIALCVFARLDGRRVMVRWTTGPGRPRLSITVTLRRRRRIPIDDRPVAVLRGWRRETHATWPGVNQVALLLRKLTGAHVESLRAGVLLPTKLVERLRHTDPVATTHAYGQLVHGENGDRG